MRAPTRGPWLLLSIALLVRIAAAFASDRIVADVLRYHKVADWILSGHLDPYQSPRLYPYPPVWLWFEAASGWLERHLALDFALVVKLPVVAADLGIVLLLLRSAGPRAGWLYALSPVSLLVTGFHGQFDALMLLALLLAIRWAEAGRPDASALALAAAIGLKSFPVLLLPFFLAPLSSLRARVRFALLACGPVALSILPFAVHDFGAVRRELLGYGGVADFGWIGALRAWRWLASGVLARSEAAHWGSLVAVAKIVFLVVLALIVWRFARKGSRISLVTACLTVFVAFLGLYGAISAQYLLWVVPLALLAGDRWLLPYTLCATGALVGFYAFLQPGILQPDPPLVAYDPRLAGMLWAAGVLALLALCLAWLAALVLRRP